jgi:NAD-dependent deacetylase
MTNYSFERKIMLNQKIKQALQAFARGSGRITVLTGAGISAESNIPTFRGPEGYWTIGSREYQPQEMATYSMFAQRPDEVWKWYLYRIHVCAQAQPNAGHLALVEMEKQFKDRFTLITQNVDDLHIRAGSSLQRTFQIHGNIFFMRCAAECTANLHPVPPDLKTKAKGENLTRADRRLLQCPDCGNLARPHVLWFDEMYNEHHYRYHSSLKVAAETSLLIVVGTSGATNLPNQVVWIVNDRDGIIVDINIEENPFARLALNSRRGFFIQTASSVALPQIMETFRG